MNKWEFCCIPVVLPNQDTDSNPKLLPPASQAAGAQVQVLSLHGLRVAYSGWLALLTA